MTEIIASLPPGSILILGGLLVPLVRGRLQQVWLLALPVVSFLHLLSFPDGYLLHVHLFDYELTLLNAGPPNQSIDPIPYARIIDLLTPDGEVDLGPIVENDFAAAFFADIGMNVPTMILANHRIAPIQIMGNGHPVSTFGSQTSDFGDSTAALYNRYGDMDTEHQVKFDGSYTLNFGNKKGVLNL